MGLLDTIRDRISPESVRESETMERRRIEADIERRRALNAIDRATKRMIDVFGESSIADTLIKSRDDMERKP